jgi:hypothetical protein
MLDDQLLGYDAITTYLHVSGLLRAEQVFEDISINGSYVS